MTIAANRIPVGLALVFVLATAGMIAADGEPGVRADLQAPNQRRAAPQFALKDTAGKTARLSQYRGHVVLLDFWATWCTGCKQEIPWFVELQQKYARQGLAVVGVSLDEEGWKTVKPFLAAHPIPYRMLVGGDAITKSYGIETMPDTFLIDRRGRLAAAYREGIVDRDNIEANIKAMLSNH